MTSPVQPPITPMLAKATADLPDADAIDGGYSYEPKWDGFRAIAFVGAGGIGAVGTGAGGTEGADRTGADGTEGAGGIEFGSRGTKMLTRYFPELVAAVAEQVTEPCVIDGEIVVRSAVSGGSRLDWETLSQRIHPAASRITRLSVETPASFVAFDLLAIGDRPLLDAPFGERRAELERLLGTARAPLHLTQTTRDVAVARRWLQTFEGAGLDGVVAKPLSAAYSPGKRTMLKIKHARTADVVVVGYRVHKSGQGVGSLLLGLHTADGELLSVGGSSAFSDARRLELVDELAPLVERDGSGAAVTGESDRNRFSSNKDTSFVRLRPERVMEVRYDQMEGMRFRHTAQFVRWRADREPRSCTFDQLDRPIAYDLDEVLQ